PRGGTPLPVRRAERQRAGARGPGRAGEERGSAMTEAARRGERRETQGRDRLDLYRAHAAEYEASREPSFVDVGPAVYLALDGEGPHGGSEFQEATAVLYNIALAIKMRRRAAGQDYATTGLEALWPEGPEAPRWRLLIRIPEFIRSEERRVGKGRRPRLWVEGQRICSR